jgi:hypothetical protein
VLALSPEASRGRRNGWFPMALLVVAGEVSPGEKKGATQSDPNKAVAVGGANLYCRTLF